MNLRLLAFKAAQTVKREGIRACVRKVLVRLRSSRVPDDFDLIRGTETGGVASLWNFQIDSPNARFGVRYQSSDERLLASAVEFLQGTASIVDTLTFIDLGCGKGRALIIASELGFKQLIGVEFAAELVQVARANLVKTAMASNATVIHADAANFRFPDSDFLLYLYNPFSAEVMQEVLRNLQSSIAKKFFVIYGEPLAAWIFDSCGLLERVEYPVERRIQIWKRIDQ